jgi:hypothetical protein
MTFKDRAGSVSIFQCAGSLYFTQARSAAASNTALKMSRRD